MTHNFLDDLEVRFILAESRTEGMAKIVRAEMRQQLRLAVLFLCLLGFGLVILPADPFYCPVDCMRIQAFTKPILKDKTAVTIDLHLISAMTPSVGLERIKPSRTATLKTGCRIVWMISMLQG